MNSETPKSFGPKERNTQNFHYSYQHQKIPTMWQIETGVTLLSQAECVVSMKTYILSKKIENRLLCNQLCIEGALMLIKREKKFNIKTRFCLHLKFSYHSSAGILKLHCLHLKAVEAFFCFQKTGATTMSSFVRSRLFSHQIFEVYVMLTEVGFFRKLSHLC